MPYPNIHDPLRAVILIGHRYHAFSNVGNGKERDVK